MNKPLKISDRSKTVVPKTRLETNATPVKRMTANMFLDMFAVIEMITDLNVRPLSNSVYCASVSVIVSIN